MMFVFVSQGSCARILNTEAFFRVNECWPGVCALAAANQILLAPATLPASLGLAITGTHAGWAECGRTDSLAGVALAGATGKTGVCGRISQPPLAIAQDWPRHCCSNDGEKQRYA